MRRAAVLSLMLAACTPLQWQKADATPEQARVDEEECRQLAWREASYRSWHYQSMMGPAFARDPTGRGYMVWPHSAVVDPFAYQMLDEQRLAQFCMESKGYALVPAPTQ
jgi:hypothetical protein